MMKSLPAATVSTSRIKTTRASGSAGFLVALRTLTSVT